MAEPSTGLQDFIHDNFLKQSKTKLQLLKHSLECFYTPSKVKQKANALIISKSGADKEFTTPQVEQPASVLTDTQANPGGSSQNEVMASGQKHLCSDTLVQTKMSSFVDRLMSEDEKQKADLSWLRYKLLPAEDLHVLHLEHEYLKNSSHLTIMLDGWDDITHRSLYGSMAAHQKHTPIMLGLEDMTGKHINSDALIPVMNKAVLSFGISSKQVIALVTDNPTVMHCF
ncbi:hypothetical protein C8Q75DRAFT_811045 [Abortiporus biennis]|nr:hypothetical protein C8Q75DRAFT_811045 [Abortiporus biennis]